MAASTHRTTVLIVEDEALIALDLAQIVEGLGYEVLGTASSAADALVMVEQRCPDVAFVDLHLTDGPTGARLAQDLASCHSVAVIIVSANCDLVSAGENGVMCAIRKPFDPEAIAAALRSAVLEAGSEFVGLQ
jgi:two-component system, response regulator PdtaR